MSSPLEDYRRKRDPARTPEPPAEPALRRRGPVVFVVHRHEATRLHYDLRLETDGVLASFAVPKGFSYRPADRHLAVRTEDHPLAYESFEGVIPRGQYGAGTMTIWDRGTFAVPDGAPLRDKLAAGKIEVVLRGRRLRGEWHLVRTTRSDRDWLMFKARDRYARGEADPPFPLDLDRAAAPARPFPRRPRPMRAASTSTPFSDPGWVFELEFEGRRVLAGKRGDEVRLTDAAGRVVREAPTGVLDDLRRLRVEEAVLDGVLVAPDDANRPSRELLERRLAGEDDGPVVLYAFDVLHEDGYRVAALPLLDRKRILASILPRDGLVLFVDHVVGEGERLARTVAATGLAGVIAKDVRSAYRGGASRSWRRIPVEPGDAAAPEPARPAPSRVRITNRRKVLWPEASLTKGDLLDHLDRVAGALLPHLHDRPLHMRRFPDGIQGKSFYHKDVPDHAPDWVETEAIESGEDGRLIRYVVCGDRDTLRWLGNLASLDLHPWMSRRGSLDTPDRVVFDLDPGPAGFGGAVRAARFVGRMLRGLGLRPYLKTSGASGLHVVLPLRPVHTYEQGRMFCEMVCRQIVREHPDLCTVERAVASRRGRVYLDFGQNRRGQTVVAPYVPRPVPAASVSMPIEWDELEGDLDPARFTLRNAAARVEERGDLHRGVLDDLQDLAPAIEAFREMLDAG